MRMILLALDATLRVLQLYRDEASRLPLFPPLATAWTYPGRATKTVKPAGQ